MGRILKFNSDKAEELIARMKADIEEIDHHLANIVEYTVDWYLMLKNKYGKNFPRRTELRNPVVLGNDVGCPWITQYDFWRELFYIHKYVGVSNAFALYTATARAAEMAGIGAETGTIEPGKSADLIVTVENPLEDLRALRKVEMVVTQGRKIDHPQVKINPVVAAELDQFLVE